MATLKFDIEKLNAVKEKCEDIKTEIDTLRGNLTKNLTNLKKEWNTSAGKKFFKENDTNWSAKVDIYISTVATIVELLESAISEYEAIAEKAKGLKL